MSMSATHAKKDAQKNVDPEDLLSDSLQFLYDYAPITHSSAGSLFRYTLPSRPPTRRPSTSCSDQVGEEERVLTLITPNTQASNWALHASSIWTSAIYVADHIEILRLDEHISAAETRGSLPLHVLELGAGAGLPSIVIAKMYPKIAVTASDYPDEELISSLKGNVARNEVESWCRVVPYAWGTDPSVFGSCADSSSEEACRFDVVFAADTLWARDLHEAFLATLCRILKRTSDARIYLIAGLHTGRYTLQAFMGMVGEYGLDLDSAIEREVHGAQSRPWDVGRAEGEDERERRLWIVEMRLKWKDIA